MYPRSVALSLSKVCHMSHTPHYVTYLYAMMAMEVGRKVVSLRSSYRVIGIILSVIVVWRYRLDSEACSWNAGVIRPCDCTDGRACKCYWWQQVLIHPCSSCSFLSWKRIGSKRLASFAFLWSSLLMQWFFQTSKRKGAQPMTQIYVVKLQATPR